MRSLNRCCAGGNSKEGRWETVENLSHLPRRFFTSAALVRSEKRETLRPAKKRKTNSFFLPNPQREGISTGRWGTSPPAASLVSSAFLEKTIFFFAFLFYAMLYFTRLPFPPLTLPILSFGGSCQLQINLWLASGCHLFDEWLPSGCHPIKWPAKGKIGDRGKPECTALCAKRRTAFPR